MAAERCDVCGRFLRPGRMRHAHCDADVRAERRTEEEAMWNAIRGDRCRLCGVERQNHCADHPFWDPVL